MHKFVPAAASAAVVLSLATVPIPSAQAHSEHTWRGFVTAEQHVRTEFPGGSWSSIDMSLRFESESDLADPTQTTMTFSYHRRQFLPAIVPGVSCSQTSDIVGSGTVPASVTVLFSATDAYVIQTQPAAETEHTETVTLAGADSCADVITQPNGTNVGFQSIPYISPTAVGPDPLRLVGETVVETGQGVSGPGTWAWDIADVNQAPHGVDDVGATDAGVGVVIAVLDNDTDPDGDALDVASVDDPANGSAVVDRGGATTTIRYTPDPDFAGADVFGYQLADSHGATDTASVRVTVAGATGTIVIQKTTVAFGADQAFTFTGAVPASLADGQSVQATRLAGKAYTVTEAATAGWDLTGLTCDAPGTEVVLGTRSATFTLSVGATVTCRFTNTQRGRILVDAVTDPSGQAQSFDFGLTGGPDALIQTFTLIDTVPPHDSGLIKPGTYSVNENTPFPAGWQLSSASCSDGSPVTAVAVSAGETVTCTFTNNARGKVDVVKTLRGGAIPSGSPSTFTFQLRQGASLIDSGTTLETLAANALNLGEVHFNTPLTPGQTYQMCEIVMPGWATTLGTFVPDSFLPPNGVAPDPTVDNSILCANFTASAGPALQFRIDNTPPPGGRALTIGFWKNWASCTKSNGGQRPVMDQTLAGAEPYGIVMSATAGGYPAFGSTFHLALHGSASTPSAAPDCLKAVRLLDKSTTSTGAKKASDPAFNLSAQLLAAELNYTAGAGKTPAVTTAITQAVLMLGKYTFTGAGYSGKISAADVATMNNLAKLLDNYNNNA